VTYATSNGTATAGSDYTAVAPTVVTFAAGETSKAVTVLVTGDTLVEPDETFTLKLSPAAGMILSDDTATATILNDDAPTYLAVDDLSVSEGNGGTTPATFTVTRSGSTAGTSSVTYATANGTATAGSDYTAVAPTVLTFAAGETSKTVTVGVTGDTAVEPNETVLVKLSSPVGAVVSDDTGTATIVDDDGTTTTGPTTFVAVNDLSVTEGNSGTTPVTFTVTRTGNTAGASSVTYATANGTALAGSDYTAVAPTVLTFAAGETAKTVTVPVTGDLVDEPDETFLLKLSSPTGATVSDDTGTATIVDDDAPAYVSLNDISVTEGNSGTTAATFTVTRSGNTAVPSSVTYATANGTATAGSDYTALAPTVLSFAAGETSKAVTVSVSGDTLAEPDETFVLKLSAPVGATISDDTGTAIVKNDDGSL
jgi:chitinase